MRKGETFLYADQSPLRLKKVPTDLREKKIGRGGEKTCRRLTDRRNAKDACFRGKSESFHGGRERQDHSTLARSKQFINAIRKELRKKKKELPSIMAGEESSVFSQQNIDRTFEISARSR